MKKLWLYIGLSTLLAGCAHQAPFAPSQGHISTQQQATEPSGDIPKPVKKLNYVPPPKPKSKDQTYSIVVTSVPVQEVLFALARESKLNVDIHPAVQGKVTLNAVDQTLPSILERLSKQVDLRYKVEGNVISITPDSPTLRTYKINYVNMDRDTTSTIGASAKIGGTSTSASDAASSGENNSATTVKSTSKNNFWGAIEENIKGILKSTKSQTASLEEKAARVEAQRNAQEERLKQVEAASKAGAGAEKLFQEAFKSQTSSATEGKDDVIVNAAAGTVTVMATEKQHEFIQRYLDAVTSSSQRQVLIEATIVEVQLSDAYQAGVNWSRLASDGTSKGLTFGFGNANAGATSTLTNATGNIINAGTSSDLVVNFIKSTSIGNLAASIKLLDTFGNVKVISSPKIMALNNQTSILKVVKNLVYFDIKSDTTTPATGPAVTNVTTTAHTVPVGLVMSVMPQISENGAITLMVRPTISSSNSTVPDPANAVNKVPVIQSREMESILRMESGQTAILGGLMTDDISKTDTQVPEASSIPLIGNLFRSKEDTVTKTELVIFLRATSIPDPSLESRELQSYKQYLPETQFPVASDESSN
ncbi:MAG: pilus (MSHA type) biogenesis protein MshL [Methylophilales bacterium]|nr:pilus (MSHA type) biogenesis protein MshL [Methylophilales bacterium]